VITPLCRRRSPASPVQSVRRIHAEASMKKTRTASHVLWLLVGTIILWHVPLRSAPVPETVWLDELTWTELEEEIRSGKTTVIVPVGGTEQNGPAIALGKHNVRATRLAEKIAHKLGNALVAPVVSYVPEGSINPPTAHMRFPGTITIPDSAFEQTLEYAARSFKLHGFRDIVFLGDHGGYQKNLQAVALRLSREWAGTSTRAHAIDRYYRAAEVDYPRALRQRGYKDAEVGTHAGLADTSLTMSIDPGLVRANRLASDANLDAAHGVSGDPHRATAELGTIGISIIVDETTDAINKAIARR
jgi:creatinine amidohydrolase